MGQDRIEVAFRRHGGAEKRELAKKNMAQIGSRVPTGGGAAGYNAPSARGAQNQLRPHLGADMVDDHIDSTLAGEPLDLAHQIAGAVIDEFVSAETARL